MTKYQQFLENIGIMPEDLFNEVINSLPEVDIDSIDFDSDYIDSQNDLADQIINNILHNWDYAYTDDVDFERKTIILDDVQSLEDLEEIKETFSKWTISNYHDIVEQLEEEKKENKENEEFDALIRKIRFNATIEQLRKFVDSL